MAVAGGAFDDDYLDLGRLEGTRATASTPRSVRLI
jgi:hypothetical protein